MLKRVRKDAALTQAQLGKLLEKPQSYVSKYETGERRIEAMELGIILSAVGIEQSEFLEELNSRL